MDPFVVALDPFVVTLGHGFTGEASTTPDTIAWASAGQRIQSTVVASSTLDCLVVVATTGKDAVAGFAGTAGAHASFQVRVPH